MIRIEDGYLIEVIWKRETLDMGGYIISKESQIGWTTEEIKYKVNLETGLLKEVKD